MSGELELALMMRVASANRRERLRAMLTTNKGRKKFIAELPHFSDFDPDASFRVPPREQSPDGIARMLRELSAGTSWYIASVNSTLHGQWAELEDAVREIVGRRPGTLLIASSAEVGYFEGEVPGERYILGTHARAVDPDG